MTRRERERGTFLAMSALLVVALAGCHSATTTPQTILPPAPKPHVRPGAPEAAPDSPEYFASQVQPIFQAYCYRCHAGGNHRGNFRMDTPKDLMHGGKEGAVIVPGRPDQSLLLQLIRHEGPQDDPMPMPPKAKLSETDIATITAWVQAGAKMQ